MDVVQLLQYFGVLRVDGVQGGVVFRVRVFIGFRV